MRRTGAWRILLVADREADAALLHRELRHSLGEISTRRVDTPEACLAQLQTFSPHVILVKYSLAAFSGPAVLKLAQQVCPDVPVIFVSGARGAEAAIGLLQSGATDSVLKHRFARLGPAVARAWREGHERRARLRAETALRQSHTRLRALTAHLQAVREEERARLSQELHDVLGQALTALKMDVAWILSKLGSEPEAVAPRARAMAALLDTTIETMRQIATELRPGILDDLGLTAALEWQAQEFQTRSGIECVFLPALPPVSIDKDRATAVFRIFQETLTNVVRHARATRVEVALRTTAQALQLQIRDNGRGILPQELKNTKSLGVLGMRERAAMFGGTVEITATPGPGTTVCVVIPLT